LPCNVGAIHSAITVVHADGGAGVHGTDKAGQAWRRRAGTRDARSRRRRRRRRRRALGGLIANQFIAISTDNAVIFGRSSAERPGHRATNDRPLSPIRAIAASAAAEAAAAAIATLPQSLSPSVSLGQCQRFPARSQSSNLDAKTRDANPTWFAENHGAILQDRFDFELITTV